MHRLVHIDRILTSGVSSTAQYLIQICTNKLAAWISIEVHRFVCVLYGRLSGE